MTLLRTLLAKCIHYSKSRAPKQEKAQYFEVTKSAFHAMLWKLPLKTLQDIEPNRCESAEIGLLLELVFEKSRRRPRNWLPGQDLHPLPHPVRPSSVPRRGWRDQQSPRRSVSRQAYIHYYIYLQGNRRHNDLRRKFAQERHSIRHCEPQTTFGGDSQNEGQTQQKNRHCEPRTAFGGDSQKKAQTNNKNRHCEERVRESAAGGRQSRLRKALSSKRLLRCARNDFR